MAHIMVVDDALFMREVIKNILAENGYQSVVEAADGETAVVLYQAEKPDVVLLDITMPNMDGIETLRRIKEHDAAARVIICSAIGQEKQMMRAITMGAREYIVKPFRPDALVRAVRKVMAE